MGAKIGCHIPAAGGYAAMVERARSIGADTFQYFTRNPRGGAVRAYDGADVQMALQGMRESNMTAIVAHAPYTLNPCAVNPRARSFAQQAFCDDLQRLQEFPMALYNLHPGCHVGQGIAEGLDRLVEFLRDNVPEDCQTVILLETMAGKGSELGGDFSQLRYVIDRVWACAWIPATCSMRAMMCAILAPCWTRLIGKSALPGSRSSISTIA